MHRAGLHLVGLQQREMQRSRRRHALDLEPVKRRAHAFERRGSRFASDNQLAEQAIVERRNDITLVEHRVEAHALAFRRRERGHLAWPRHEVLRRVFGIDPHFDSMAADRDVGLAEGQRLAARNAQHGLHEIHAGDHLRHRMLDLDARVHLDEEELVRRFVVEIFERASPSDS